LLRAANVRVRDRTWTKSRYEALEKMLGLSLNEYGLLCDEGVRSVFDPTVAIRYDWAHSFLQEGIVTTEMYLFIAHCSEHLGLRERDLCDFLKNTQWSFPKATAPKSQKLWRIWDTYRVNSSTDANRLKCSISELFSVYGLVRFYIHSQIAPLDGFQDVAAAQFKSFLSLCECVDTIISAKRAPDHESCRRHVPILRASLAEHMNLFIEAYGDARVVPKAHWALDIPHQVETDGFVIDSFVLERLHISVKSVADLTKNTERFERSVLSGVLNKHVRELQDLQVGSGLLGRITSRPDFPNLAFADHLDYDNMKLSIKDVVVQAGGHCCGVVIACVADMESFTLHVWVDILVFDSRITPQAAQWQFSGERAVWPVARLRPALAWRDLGDGRLIVLSR